MITRVFFAAALAGLFATACSSNDSTHPDAGATTGSGTGGGGPDAGSDHDGGTKPVGPKHKVVERDLLGMPANNLLLDPFVSTDTSYGHFVGVAFNDQDASYYANYFPARAIQSLSPSGVALPVLNVIPPPSISNGLSKFQVVSPFAGGSVPFDASIWVSARQGTKGVAFKEAAADLVVTLLPNDDLTHAYPLAPSGKPALLDGRQWVKLALASPTSLTEGGWFSIVTTSTQWTFDVQAPAVTPSTAGGGHRAPSSVVARGSRDAAALRAYVEITRRKH